MSVAAPPLPITINPPRDIHWLHAVESIGSNGAAAKLPTHLDLPFEDGELVENYRELPQTELLNSTLRPVLRRMNPDGQFAIGGNSGVYWSITDPPLRGAVAPDWFCVSGVDPTLANGTPRRSYVMWQERKVPQVVIEYISRDGKKERDTTPNTGKFWIYENGVRAPYYVIFDSFRGTLEVHHLEGKFYRPVQANEHGRFPIPELGIEFGLWRGYFGNENAIWLRAWNSDGSLIPAASELVERMTAQIEEKDRDVVQEKQRADVEKNRADVEKQRAEREKQRADVEKQHSEKLAAKLRALGLDPDAP